MSPEEVAPTGLHGAAIKEAALLLALSARPVIWAGGGVIQARAFDELASVASALCAPVVTSISGKGAISDSHPMAVGSLAETPEVARLLGGADAALVVGSTLSARSTRKGQLPMPMQLFHVDTDPSAPARHYPTRAGIEADARAALAALAGELRALAASGTGALRDLEGAAARVAALASSARERVSTAAGAGAAAALNSLRRAVPAGVASVWDLTPARWAVPLFAMPDPGRFSAPPAGAPAGWSLAAAAGIAAARGQPVVAVLSAGELVSRARDLVMIVGAGSAGASASGSPGARGRQEPGWGARLAPDPAGAGAELPPPGGAGAGAELPPPDGAGAGAELPPPDGAGMGAAPVVVVTFAGPLAGIWVDHSSGPVMPQAVRLRLPALAAIAAGFGLRVIPVGEIGELAPALQGALAGPGPSLVVVGA